MVKAALGVRCRLPWRLGYSPTLSLSRAVSCPKDFRRRLDHHLRSEKPNPVAGRGRACQSIGSLNTVNTAPAWSREQAPAGPACCPMSSLSAAGGGHDAAAARGKSSVFQSSNTASKDDARPASSHGSQAVLAGDDSRSGDQAASGEEGATGRSPGLDQQQQQQQQQQQPSNGVAAVAGAGGGGGGHSVAQTERRRPEGREGGVASNAELAAVKEQVSHTHRLMFLFSGVFCGGCLPYSVRVALSGAGCFFRCGLLFPVWVAFSGWLAT